jgi:hypothetical protein
VAGYFTGIGVSGFVNEEINHGPHEPHGRDQTDQTTRTGPHGQGGGNFAGFQIGSAGRALHCSKSC